MRPVKILLAMTALLLAAPGPEPWPAELTTWVPEAGNPVFMGTGRDTWDRKIRERGWVLVEDGRYRLWYTGYNEERSPSRFLGLAESRDGVHWERHPANPLTTSGWVEDVCVVKHEGEYVMFAEGEGDIAHMLTSNDGLRWTEKGPLDIRKVDGSPIAPGPRGTPTVIVIDGVWNLLYERGDRGVWLARSKDRKVWTNVSDAPVLAMGPADYDSQAVAIDQVVRRGGWYYAFYHANRHLPWKADWTTCLARSADLERWEKCPGNPLVTGNSSSGMLVEAPGGARLFTMHPEVRRFRAPGEPRQR